MPAGVGGVDTYNGGLIYGVSALAEMYARMDGNYAFSVNPVAITTNGWMFVRGYHRVVSDEILAANSYIDSYYGNDYVLYGGAGIYVTFADGVLYIMFKTYNPAKYGSVDMVIFTTALDAAPARVDITDDGETVTVYVNGKAYATVTLSGETVYDNIKAENCAPGNVFAATATIVLADGQTHTVENTLIAAHAENSELGIVARDGYFTFNELKVDTLSGFEASQAD
jgi:dihydrofolate reductase